MQAKVVYQHNMSPVRWLGVVGIFFIKALLAIPHLIIVNALSSLAMAAAYIGYFVVAFTGSLPMGLQDFVAWWLRWEIRAFGWLAGINDVYPPFEIDPTGYGVDAEIPRNEDPNKGWAISGIFLIKIIAAIPHLIVIMILSLLAAIGAWLGFFAVAFTGKLPTGIQDFVAGTMQWSARVMAWIAGLTDEYPPFELSAESTA